MPLKHYLEGNLTSGSISGKITRMESNELNVQVGKNNKQKGICRKKKQKWMLKLMEYKLFQKNKNKNLTRLIDQEWKESTIKSRNEKRALNW